jgi:hypothetical protein
MADDSVADAADERLRPATPKLAPIPESEGVTID